MMDETERKMVRHRALPTRRRSVMDRTQFLNAARESAWTVDNPDSPDHGRALIHSRGSFVGADWDLSAVLGEISGADEVWWDVDGSLSAIMGHQLACRTGDRVLRFEVRKPRGGE